MDTVLRRAGFAVFLLLLAFLHGVSGQAPANTVDDSYSQVTPSMVIIIVVLIAALFFMGFFSIYIRHCTEAASDSRRPGGTIHLGRASRRGAGRGLESSVVETFPTLQYSEVKEHKIGKGALECAVCLNEFEEEETLRLIPKCDHVFHQECIDPWLASHVTCPVCRANLNPQPADGDGGSDLQAPLPPQTELDLEAAVSAIQDAAPVVEPTFERSRTRRSKSGRPPLQFFPKSHSTGHSLVPPGENTDRFTLRLPAEVRMRIMNRQLERSKSWVAFRRETSSRRGYRASASDGSSRGKNARAAEKLGEAAAKSDRVFARNPSFLARASSFLTRGSSKSTKVMSNNNEATSSRPITLETNEPSRLPV